MQEKNSEAHMPRATQKALRMFSMHIICMRQRHAEYKKKKLHVLLLFSVTIVWVRTWLELLVQIL